MKKWLMESLPWLMIGGGLLMVAISQVRVGE